jgi:hypothetical protein
MIKSNKENTTCHTHSSREESHSTRQSDRQSSVPKSNNSNKHIDSQPNSKPTSKRDFSRSKNSHVVSSEILKPRNINNGLGSVPNIPNENYIKN